MPSRLTVVERGREGGSASGVLRRARILDRVRHLPIEPRVLEAYRQGYDAGYHAARKRARKARLAA